jgi:Uma2 family endonuclease
VRLYAGTYREPDVFYLRDPMAKISNDYPTGADLVIEVVSKGAEDRERDYVAKRLDYSKAGIAEYWIVDPQEKKITVLVLDGASYREHGVFGPGATATSVFLAGFSVKVDDVFSAGGGPAA